MVELLLILLKRYSLWGKILPRDHIFASFIGLGIIIRPTIYRWKISGPVSMDMFHRSGPFQGVGSPWVLRSPLSVEYRVDKVVKEYQLHRSSDDSKHRDQYVDIGKVIKIWESCVVIITSGKTGHSHEVHREEDSVGTNDGYPKVDKP